MHVKYIFTNIFIFSATFLYLLFFFIFLKYGPRSYKTIISDISKSQVWRPELAARAAADSRRFLCDITTYYRMTTRRGLSLDVIDVAGHEVGMERTVLRTRTSSAGYRLAATATNLGLSSDLSWFLVAL